MKKVGIWGLILLLAFGTTSCGRNQNQTDNGSIMGEQTGGGRVYYLNFKPELDAQWKELAKAYTKETGVEVTVLTAASGTYEEKLKSEIAKKEAPTIFSVNGPVGLSTWENYCYDLSKTELFDHLTGDFYLTGQNQEVAAIAYALETYGLIYNKKIMADYCTLDNAVISSAKEIENFETLKAVADDIQKRKEELNQKFGYQLKGAFSSAGLEDTSYWRFTTHLANMPIYYEYKDLGVEQAAEIQGTYLENYKNLWDLYITDGTVAPGLLSNSTVDESEAEFGMQEAVFFQNGDWEYANLTNEDNGYLVSASDLGMLPLYTGVDGEESIGLCTGSETYWCVNRQASQEDIDASIAFLEWCITSDTGRKSIAKDMGLAAPFDTFSEEYQVENVFKAEANQYIAAGKTAVPWYFSTIPSENWKRQLTSALIEYSQGTATWEEVKTAFVDGWKREAMAAQTAQ